MQIPKVNKRRFCYSFFLLGALKGVRQIFEKFKSYLLVIQFSFTWSSKWSVHSPVHFTRYDTCFIFSTAASRQVVQFNGLITKFRKVLSRQSESPTKNCRSFLLSQLKIVPAKPLAIVRQIRKRHFLFPSFGLFWGNKSNQITSCRQLLNTFRYFQWQTLIYVSEKIDLCKQKRYVAGKLKIKPRQKRFKDPMNSINRLLLCGDFALHLLLR